MNNNDKPRSLKSPCGGFRGLLLAILFIFTACQGMLETDSNRLVSDDDYQLTNPEDPYATIAGILTELQQVADRYVLLGELRGDLMNTSTGAVFDLQEVNNFRVSTGNEYTDKRAYYNIINNCNYALQRMDTSLVIQTNPVMLPAYAELKTIRAWTYFQLAQVFGRVVYLTEPITDLDGSLSEETPIALDELVDRLVTDLRPYMAVPVVRSNVSPDAFMPAALLLGDLYLYQQNYNEAARMYYRIMKYGVEETPRELNIASAVNRWLAGFEYAEAKHLDVYDTERLAAIYFSRDAKNLHSKLVNLSLNDKPSILPSTNFVEAMTAAQYYYTASADGSGIISYREGDLRGNIQQRGDFQVGDAYFYVNTQYSPQPEPLIFKYYYAGTGISTGSDPDNELLNKEFKFSLGGSGVNIRLGGLYYLPTVPVYRIPHLYLRYAEAVNRAGKPTLAFAVLKYGLTEATLNNPARVNPAELGEDYTNFTNSGTFDGNTAMAVRGRGYGIQNTSVYMIPDLIMSATGLVQATRQDSIEWVEDRILEELAAETAFEGNRFFDLLCVSRNRPNHPQYMAKKVAAKYNDAAAMEAKLSDINTWFLP
jgi:hypothetical protein